MSILESSDLPVIRRLADEGFELVSNIECERRKLQILKVGLLNMMPDKAISATERQFLRLTAGSNQWAIEFYPFSIAGIPRTAEVADYFSSHYFTFAQIQKADLDALIVTGANITQPRLTQEPFWSELETVLRWADAAGISTLCSCLATHAAFKVFYNVDRRHLGNKCWGVYSHSIPKSAQRHPIVKGVAGDVSMPHSRFNDVSRQNMEENNVLVTLVSDQVGVQMALEPDMSRVYFQGHPEYDDISLLKEYKREIFRFAYGERAEYPPYPVNYFSAASIGSAEQFKQAMLEAEDRTAVLEKFPEQILAEGLLNHWRHIAIILFENWLAQLVPQN